MANKAIDLSDLEYLPEIVKATAKNLPADYILSGARMTCTQSVEQLETALVVTGLDLVPGGFSQSPQEAIETMINANAISNKTISGDRNGNSASATEFSCVRMKNIQPFGHCKSPTLVPDLEAYMSSLPAGHEDEKAEYQAAIKARKELEAGKRERNFAPLCVLPLINRWLETSETETASNYMALVLQLTGKMEPLQKLAKKIANDTQSALTMKIGATESAFVFDMKADNALIKKINQNESYYKYITAVIIPEIEKLQKNLVSYAGDSAAMQNRIGQIIDQVKQFKHQIDSLDGLDRTTTEYAEFEKSINELLAALAEVKVVLDGGITEAKRITMDSFTICRCGGIIYFKTSGQEILQYHAEIYNRMIEMFKELVDFLQNCRNKGMYLNRRDADRLNGYKLLRSAKTSFQVLSDQEATDKLPSTVFIDFIPNSYFLMQEKSVMIPLMALSLFSMPIGTVAGLINLSYNIFNTINSVNGEMAFSDQVSAGSTLSGPVGDFSKKVARKVKPNYFYIQQSKRSKDPPVDLLDGVDLASKGLSIFDKALTVVGMFTLLLEQGGDWIEKINIHIFEGDMGVIHSSILNKDGALLSKDTKLRNEADYITDIDVYGREITGRMEQARNGEG